MKKGKPNNTIVLPQIKDWHAVVVICALVALFFRDILLQNTFFWEDFLYQFYPFRNFAAVSLAGGELPLWNPFTFSGTPFQADIQSAVFYILNLLLTFFVSGGKLNFYWLEVQIIIHIMIAGVGAYFLAKEFGMHRIAALFSGLTFSLSGFMVTHTIHQVIICQVAWLPLIVLLFRRAILSRSVYAMILGGFVLGNAILAGFPQVSLYIFLFLFFYFVFELFSEWKNNSFSASLKISAIAAGFIMIAIAFTAIQLLPTIELAPLSQRAAITYEKSQEGQMSWQQLITLLIPKYFGSSGADGYTFWGAGAYWVYWETCFYIGIPSVLLLLFSIFRWRTNKYIWFFFSIGIFSILYALGDNFVLHNLFFHYIPGFDKFRSVGRITLLSTFSFSVLTGYGIEAMLQFIVQSPQKFKKLLIVISSVFVVIFLLSQSGWMQGNVDRRIAEQIHASVANAATTMFVVALLSLGLIYFISKRFSTILMIGVLLIIQFIDINIFGFTQNNGTTNPEEYYRRTENIVNGIREAGKSEIFRVNSRRENNMILDRNQGMVDRIFMMEGYTPLSLQRIYPPVQNFDRACDLLNAKFKLVVDEKNRYMNLVPSDSYLPRAFFVYNSTIIKNEDSIRAYMSSEMFNPRSTVVFEEDPQFVPEGSGVGGSVSIKSYSLNKIILQTESSKNGFLVMSEIFYPGWIAYIDGKAQRVMRGDWSLRAIPVEAGKHEIDMRYEPQSFKNGAMISISTLILGSGVIIFLQFKKKYKKEQKTEAI
jgi:hypothetical protein